MGLQRGQVEEPLMMKWLCQLLLALDYLQTMRVLHRDIKTSNLLLTCDMDVQLGTAAWRKANSSICRNGNLGMGICLPGRLQHLFSGVLP
jgi:serine/threonine protein kinase